jgi:hypothetical protein
MQNYEMRNLQLISYLLIFTFVSIAFSCRKPALEQIREAPSVTCYHNQSNPVFNFMTNDFSTNTLVNYDTALCGIMPLGRNYKWIYRDSVFGINGQFLRTEYDTLFVEKTVRFPGSQAVWWKMKSTLGKEFVPYNHIYITDSVMYFLEPSYVASGLRTFNTNESWLRLDNHFFFGTSGVLVDVAFRQSFTHGQSIVVPAGTYSNSVLCEKRYFFLERIFFETNTGVVKVEQYAPGTNLPDRNKLLRISELVSFIQ